jgi:hypothetical protein
MASKNNCGKRATVKPPPVTGDARDWRSPLSLALWMTALLKAFVFLARLFSSGILLLQREALIVGKGIIKSILFKEKRGGLHLPFLDYFIIVITKQ